MWRLVMGSTLEAFLAHSNDTRYHAQPAGHYESFFQRANHPSRPLAFWIRYTIFSPRRRPVDAVGELWAVWFDGERERIVAAKQEVPVGACAFGDGELLARIGTAT